MKGERKKHRFCKGNVTVKRKPSACNQQDKCFNSVWLPRLSHEKFQTLTKKSFDSMSYYMPGSEDSPDNVKLLRPHPPDPDPYPQFTTPENREMRVVDKYVTVEMINNLFVCHTQLECANLFFEIASESKWGLGWIWTFGCKNCKFKSKPYKLFHEIPSAGKGRRTAEINYGVQTGLYQSPIGNDQARLILTCSGIPPPARSAMYKSCNKVGQKIVDIAEEDMNQRVDQLKNRNKMLGLPESHPINIQMDATYQSRGITSRHKMGQGASQVIGVACEDMINIK